MMLGDFKTFKSPFVALYKVCCDLIAGKYPGCFGILATPMDSSLFLNTLGIKITLFSSTLCNPCLLYGNA